MTEGEGKVRGTSGIHKVSRKVNLILQVLVYHVCSPQDERQERIQASLREKEREVAISCTAHKKEWGKERH